ncbi:MAG: FmdB family zinc ribbon protein [Actinomycetes bacterium]
MATYPYRCQEHGAFDVIRPIGSAAVTSHCPTCGGDAIRVFSPPMLAHTSAALAAAHQRDEQSREAPEVVSVLPPRRSERRAKPANPAVRDLPRP